jgi:hypothetical protein
MKMNSLLEILLFAMAALIAMGLCLFVSPNGIEVSDYEESSLTEQQR